MCAELLAALAITDKGVNRVEERSDIVRRNAHPSVGISSSRATADPLSIAAITGLPTARIEYVFDGTLTEPRPVRKGTT